MMIDGECGAGAPTVRRESLAVDGAETEGEEDATATQEEGRPGDGSGAGTDAARRGQVKRCQRFIVPSLFNRKVPGTFFIRVHANRKFSLTKVDDNETENKEVSAIKQIVNSNNRVEVGRGGSGAGRWGGGRGGGARVIVGLALCCVARHQPILHSTPP